MAKASKVMFVTIDGQRMRVSKDNSTLNPGGFTKAPLTGANSFDHTAEPREAELNFEVIHTAGQSVAYFNQLENVQVEVELDTGGVWIMENAFSTGEATLEDGMVKNIKMHSAPVEEDV